MPGLAGTTVPHPRRQRGAPCRGPSVGPAVLIDLQDQYRAWLDNLPASLDGSRLADKLQAIVELDLEELHAIGIPRGYGRD